MTAYSFHDAYVIWNNTSPNVGLNALQTQEMNYNCLVYEMLLIEVCVSLEIN
jgi:hypothetical protein